MSVDKSWGVAKPVIWLTVEGRGVWLVLWVSVSVAGEIAQFYSLSRRVYRILGLIFKCVEAKKRDNSLLDHEVIYNSADGVANAAL